MNEGDKTMKRSDRKRRKDNVAEERGPGEKKRRFCLRVTVKTEWIKGDCKGVKVHEK